MRLFKKFDKFRFDMLNQVYHTLPQKNTPVLLSYAALRTVYIYKSKATPHNSRLTA